MTAWFAGFGKEIVDTVNSGYGFGRLASCYSAFEKQDFIDNSFGRGCAEKQSCFERCAGLKDQPDKR
jgi:hypothetical protein